MVLARDVVVEAGRPVDPRWPLRRLAGQYPSCWTFAVDGLLGATPEMLVRLEKGVATSRVLAGTDVAANLALIEELCETMKFGSLCALGGFTPYPVMSALTHFPEDFARAREVETLS